MKFYADEHINAAAIAGLRRRGIDILATREAGMSGSSDEEQIAFALDHRRIVITSDVHFLSAHASGAVHPGIAFCRQRSAIGRIIQGIILINEALDEEAMRCHVEYL